MQLHIDEDHLALSKRAAQTLAEAISKKPNLNIVVATGTSPIQMYAELADMQQKGLVDCRKLNVFQLDAYLGTSDTDDRSLYGWMKRAFVDPLEIPYEQVIRMDKGSTDAQANCEAYINAVKAHGGFDVAILGLGPNGHLGFNEPPSPREAPTRVVSLSEESFISNARYWGGRDRVPPLAVTAGMDILLDAKLPMLLVSGETKCAILEKTLNGPVTPMVPASYFQEATNSMIFADRAAMGELRAYTG
jgi:glucosamine-6-phosphate deaminase